MLKHKKKIIVLFIMLVIFSGWPKALWGLRTEEKESTIIIGQGTGRIPEGRYEPLLLIWHLGFPLRLPQGDTRVDFFIETQFNPSFRPETDYEFGISPGLKLSHSLTQRLSLYLLAAVGPHYISLVTTKQANGFIFSDTLGAGISFDIQKDRAISIGYRFRHLSNAGLSSPNGGVNTHFLTIGYSIFF